MFVGSYFWTWCVLGLPACIFTYLHVYNDALYPSVFILELGLACSYSLHIVAKYSWFCTKLGLVSFSLPVYIICLVLLFCILICTWPDHFPITCPKYCCLMYLWFCSKLGLASFCCLYIHCLIFLVAFWTWFGQFIFTYPQCYLVSVVIFHCVWPAPFTCLHYCLYYTQA